MEKDYLIKGHFDGIPIISTFYSHPLDRNTYYVDSSTVLIDRQGIRHLFFGHSGKKCFDEAILISRIEILERVMASPLANLSMKPLLFSNYLDPTVTRIMLAKDYLIRNGNPLIGTTGLGAHSKSNLAEQHAILEMLERHILCEIWYKDRKIRKIGSRENLPLEYFIDYYTTLQASPFILAVLQNKNLPIFLCGSSLKENQSDALMSSRIEALMLAGNFLCKSSSDTSNNILSLKRMRNLCTSAVLNKLRYFLIKVSNLPPTKINYQKYDIMEICKAIQFPFETIYTCPIKKRQSLILYRAYSSYALTKEKSRIQYPYLEEDPFC
ncbi:hypothetical protein [Okeania sp. SIO2B3]|uniref:hypothetical protein n=1 Tax=Okeania sp. SIO2B3 TaxID=2607784 RepID=UPI0013C0442F|nr:hypothetical protein [Okeania sp. SIO2B3]NET44743.1 hypothetical protein [Okeania sp. SIO2B3]